MAFYAKATLHNYFERAINLWICITRCDFHLPLCTIEQKSLHPIDPQSRINLLRSPGCSSTSNFKTAAAAGIARSEAQFAGTHLLWGTQQIAPGPEAVQIVALAEEKCAFSISQHGYFEVPQRFSYALAPIDVRRRSSQDGGGTSRWMLWPGAGGGGEVVIVVAIGSFLGMLARFGDGGT